VYPTAEEVLAGREGHLRCLLAGSATCLRLRYRRLTVLDRGLAFEALEAGEAVGVVRGDLHRGIARDSQFVRAEGRTRHHLDLGGRAAARSLPDSRSLTSDGGLTGGGRLAGSGRLIAAVATVAGGREQQGRGQRQQRHEQATADRGQDGHSDFILQNLEKRHSHVLQRRGERCGFLLGREGEGELLSDDYLALHVYGVEVALVAERADLVERELQRGRRSGGDRVRVGDIVIAAVVGAVLAGGARVVDGDPLIGQVHLYGLSDLDGEGGVLLVAQLEEVIGHIHGDFALDGDRRGAGARGRRRPGRELSPGGGAVGGRDRGPWRVR